MLQRAQNSAFRMTSDCIRCTPTVHLHTEVKVSLLKYLDLRGSQIFSAAAAIENQLDEKLHNSLGARRHMRTTSSEHFTTLHARISTLPLERSYDLWLHESFVALVTSPPNTLLKDPHCISVQLRLI